MASDGLWDVLANHEVTETARLTLDRAEAAGLTGVGAARKAASTLAKAAMARGTRDNTTVLLVNLRGRRAVPGGQAGEGCVGEGKEGVGEGQEEADGEQAQRVHKGPEAAGAAGVAGTGAAGAGVGGAGSAKDLVRRVAAAQAVQPAATAMPTPATAAAAPVPAAASQAAAVQAAAADSATPAAAAGAAAL